MNNTIKAKIAIGVGYYFVIANSEDVKHISLEGTNTYVSVQNQTFMLYKGTTFADSRKIDEIIDSGKYPERKTSAYRVDVAREGGVY